MASESDDNLRQPDPAVRQPAPDSTAVPRRRRRSQLTVALVAGAVLAAGGGGAYWAASAADNSPGANAGPLPLVLDVATTPGAPVKVTGTLPDGPASAPVYRPDGRVSQERVAALAAALRVPGTLKSAKGQWTATADGRGPRPTLQVSQSAPDGWAYAQNGAGGSCKPPAGGSAGDQLCFAPNAARGPDDAPVSEARARQLAAPVLTALGLNGAEVDASKTAGAIRTVTADPVVGGLPTHGWRTMIQIGPDGTVLSGTGRLVPLAKGDTYPVVSAQQAVKELHPAGTSQQRCGGMMHPGARSGTAAETDAGTTGSAPERASAPCLAPTTPVTVTGARFGLSLQFVSGQQELVPSWLFRITRPVTTAPEGVAPLTQVLAQPAVDPKYLIAPDTGVHTPGTPPPSSAPGAGAQARQHVESYAADGRTVSLKFWGGVCSDYSAKVIDQTSTAVHVQVVGVAKHPGQKCPMLAKEVTVRVTLDAPLNGRTLYDSSDQHRVPAKQS